MTRARAIFEVKSAVGDLVLLVSNAFRSGIAALSSHFSGSKHGPQI